MNSLLIAIWLVAGSVGGEIIDRMVGVVNNHLITQSDLRMERSIQAILDKPATKNDKEILRELIDVHLIDEQISQFPGIEISTAEVAAELGRHQNLNGVSQERLREAIVVRLRRAEFFRIRFVQFIRPTDDEVLQYYKSIFVPAAEKSGLQPVPAMESIVDQVRSNVINEKLSLEVERWLEAIRKRSSIEILE